MTRNSGRLCVGMLLCVLLFAVAGVEQCPPPSDYNFSFAIIADPHLYPDEPENETRLRGCVDYINTNKDELRIELVFIAGDLGSQMSLGKEILDGLTVPYVPVIGDNAIQGGYEDVFYSTFEPHYAELSMVLENWQKAPTPVYNPEIGAESYFQNFSFDYKMVHFMGLDWATRIVDPILGEFADLHDFDGGTFPWFQQDIETCTKDLGENIVMVSHHPMSILGFDPEEDNQIDNVTSAYGDFVYGDFYGHLHYRDLIPDTYKESGQYWLYLTEACHVDDNNIGLVRVYENETAFDYIYEHIDIP